VLGKTRLGYKGGFSVYSFIPFEFCTMCKLIKSKIHIPKKTKTKNTTKKSMISSPKGLNPIEYTSGIELNTSANNGLSKEAAAVLHGERFILE
jgi:hypothetical protein